MLSALKKTVWRLDCIERWRNERALGDEAWEVREYWKIIQGHGEDLCFHEKVTYWSVGSYYKVENKIEDQIIGLIKTNGTKDTSESSFFIWNESSANFWKVMKCSSPFIFSLINFIHLSVKLKYNFIHLPLLYNSIYLSTSICNPLYLSLPFLFLYHSGIYFSQNIIPTFAVTC